METPTPAEARDLSRLAHEMSNSLAYVVTNLNLLNEQLHDERFSALVQDALEGSERLGELVRLLREASWRFDGGGPEPERTPDPAPPTGEPVHGRVLVIDDEAPILVAVKRALRGHDVHTCTSGERALELLATNEYDVILCDLVMGELTGMALHRQLREQRPALADHLLFMTAGGFTPETRAFLRDVPNTVLHKPFDAKTLRWMVAQHLREQSARRAKATEAP